MNITKVEIQLAEITSEKQRLLAFVQIELDRSFVINDIKIIRGANGRTFCAMPNRPLTDKCPYCKGRNRLSARFCNYCGKRLADDRDLVDCDWCYGDGEIEVKGEFVNCEDCEGSGLVSKLYADICFPLNRECRAQIESLVLGKFQALMALPC